MKEIFKKEYTVPARWLFFILFLLVIIVSTYYAYQYTEEKSQLYLSILAGLATGTIIALIQFILAWREAEIVDKFEAMGVIDILPTRDDRDVYGEIIQNTSERLWVMGNTATRLLRDFADEGNTANPYGKALIEALQEGVDVKILITIKKNLKKEEDKKNFFLTKAKLIKLKDDFPENFDFRYYKHTPNHSIFIFDYECFLGSIFANSPSKETPVIRMKTKSEYAKKYIQVFNDEWDEAEELNDDKN